MKNRIKLQLLIVLAMLLVFAGCGKAKESDGVVNDKADEKENVSVKDDELDSSKDSSDDEGRGDLIDNPPIKYEKLSSDNTIGVLTGTVYANEYSEDDYSLLLACHYPVIGLDAASTEKYPELAKALDDFSDETEGSITEGNAELIESAKADKKDNPEFFNGYTNTSELIVHRADNDVLSFTVISNSFTGGAHGSYGTLGYNYDVKTGKKLLVSDIFSDMTEFQNKVEEKLYENYESEAFFENGIKDYFDSADEENITFSLGYEGMTVIFNPYEIGPYASGEFMVNITYDEIKDMGGADYSSKLNAYAEQLSVFKDYTIDGEHLVVVPSFFYDEETGEMSDYLESLDIEWGTKNLKDEVYGFSTDLNLIHNSDGKRYLYVSLTQESDHCQTNVYELGDDIKKVDSFSGYLHGYMTNRNNVLMSSIISDPECFDLEVRTDILGTQGVFRSYKVGDDGMPVPIEDLYHYTEPNKIVTNEIIEAVAIDTETYEEGEKATISAGTSLTPFATDNETFVDVIIDDEQTLMRIKVDISDYPQKVNGEDVEKLFSGIVFAS